MGTITSEEIKILTDFLNALKKYMQFLSKRKFTPKQISIIYNYTDDKKRKLRWISYHNWFNQVFKNEGATNRGPLQTALDIPMSIIVNLEHLLKKKRLLNRADERKLNKVVKLLREIEFEWE